MESQCTCGHNHNREWLEKHEKEVWSLVEKYENGEEEPDLEALQAWFKRPRHAEWAGLADNYIPPKVQAAMLYKTGAHKKTIFEILAWK